MPGDVLSEQEQAAEMRRGKRTALPRRKNRRILVSWVSLI